MTFAVVLKLKRFLPQSIHVAVGKQSGTLRLAGESCYWRILKQNITGEAQNFLQKCELPFPPLALKDDFIFLGSKISADGDCSHDIKRCLLLGSKTMTNLGNILKNRDITLATKVHLIKAMFFPVVMYGCES